MMTACNCIVKEGGELEVDRVVDKPQEVLNMAIISSNSELNAKLLPQAGAM